MHRMAVWGALLVLCAAGSATAAGSAWDIVDAVLHQEIAAHSFPGCVALVANASGVLYTRALGSFTYGAPAPASGTNPPMTGDTLFDLASLTKVLATTSAAMTFYQRGELVLGEAVASARLLGPGFAANGKGGITVLNLLLHNAGFPPDPDPEYWSPGFGCPATAKYHPPEVFGCRARVYPALLKQTLDHPPGTVYVYSDLSMITMMFVLGKLSRDLGYTHLADLRPDCALGGPTGIEQCHYEAYVRKHVLQETGMASSGFLPPEAEWKGCAPAWNDTDGSSPGPAYRHLVLQGQVSDGNSYALGGIAGHAGLFSKAADIHSLLTRILFAQPADPWVNATTRRLFTTVHNTSQSSRALGWDTNNYHANTYRGCANFSSTTFTHTGYTGTQVCNDPERGVLSILLTNRVYPVADDASEARIHRARQRFNNAVVAVVDQAGR